MRYQFSLPFILAAFATVSPAASLLTNGSFEAVDASAPPYFITSSLSTPGWTQILDGVDLVHNSYTQGPPLDVLVDASDGVQFLDMNQGGYVGGIFQEVAVDAGTTYHLSLDTSAWAVNSIGGTIGYDLYDPTSSTILASGSYTDSVGGAWITRTLDAVAINSTLGVRIYGIHSAQAGMGLDNVQLSSDVPEPSTFLLAALAGLVALIPTRRKA